MPPISKKYAKKLARKAQPKRRQILEVIKELKRHASEKMWGKFAGMHD